MKIYAALLCACLSCLAPLAMAGTPGEIPIGSVLREAKLDPLSGPAKPLSAWRGKPLVINVWASWCTPCRAEMASLQGLAKRYGGRQFNVIGISTDDYRDRALAYLRDTGTTFPSYIDHRLELENMLGANRIPLTLLVDANGRILEKIYGAHDWNSQEARDFIASTFRIKL